MEKNFQGSEFQNNFLQISLNNIMGYKDKFLNQTQFSNINNNNITYENMLMEKQYNNISTNNKSINNYNLNLSNKLSFSNLNNQQFNNVSNSFFYRNLLYQNPILFKLNEQLKKENEQKEIKEKIKEENKSDLITNESFNEIIQKMESIQDSRFQQSKFLHFIKDIKDRNIIINEKENTINPNFELQNEKMEKIWNNISNQIDNISINNNTINNINQINEKNQQNKIEKDLFTELENKIKQNPCDSESLYKLAKLYMEYNNDELAIKYALESLNYDSFHLQSIFLLSMCYLNEGNEMKGIYYLIQYLKNHRKIYSEFKKYLNNNIYLSEEMINKYINEDINFENKLEFITNENNKQKIISELKKSLEQISIKLNDTDVFLSLGLINIISENYNLAKEYLLKAVKLNENDYSLWNRIGVVCQNENKIDEAISYYNKAIEINKNYPRCLINLGIAFFTIEDYFSSMKYFISALKLNKEIPEVWNYLTSIFISIEREDLLNLANKKDLNGINQILF